MCPDVSEKRGQNVSEKRTSTGAKSPEDAYAQTKVWTNALVHFLRFSGS
jgi:hypothetical protein